MTTCLMCQARLKASVNLWSYLRPGPLDIPVLCPDCQALWKMPQPSSSSDICWGCGRVLVQEGDRYHQATYRQQEKVYCLDCQYWLTRVPTAYLHHQVLCHYQAPLRDWLHRYKYLGDVRQARVARTCLKAFAVQHPQAQWLVLPSSPASLVEQQFHPTLTLLKEAGLSVACPLRYQGDGRKQAGKSRQDRLALGHVFTIDEDVLAGLSDWGEWWLFDDVYTTGATLMQAKQCLYPLAQARQVPLYSCSLFRELAPEEE